ncbi:MAG: hypothetical protein P8R54_07480 [Myxococcota bacterium]|nr:hypothetical protein [Myxococcota bacterium]
MLLFLAVAFAATYDQIQARLTEVEPLRESRLERGAPRSSEDDIRKAAQGTVSVHVSGHKAWATTVINLPIGKFWAGLNDETRHPGYTAVAYSELLKGSPCQSGRAVLQYLPVPMVSDRWWIGHIRSNNSIARESSNSVREMVWRGSIDPSEVNTESGRKIIDKAEPIGSTRGGWFLVALDQFSTYVEYYSKTNPGEGIPSSISSRLAAQGVRDNIAAMKKFATTGRPVCRVF